ncbi:hypothetical protein [Neobacillus sp. SAB-20_R2A]|uniref:hypothetical protein n=1 Tax=Neobacillus sp. SAB-20_R2A TaxID=3120519 RepID=UPI003C6DF02B
MKVEYKLNEKLIELTEKKNGDDFEFSITLLSKEQKKGIEKVRQYFDDNKVLTDIHFYIHANNRYQVIVRNDFYNDFLIQLFKEQFLLEVKWV